MLRAGLGPLSRPSEASPKGCLDNGPSPALFTLMRAKRAHGAPFPSCRTHKFCYRSKFHYTAGVYETNFGTVYDECTRYGHFGVKLRL